MYPTLIISFLVWRHKWIPVFCYVVDLRRISTNLNSQAILTTWILLESPVRKPREVTTRLTLSMIRASLARLGGESWGESSGILLREPVALVHSGLRGKK